MSKKQVPDYLLCPSVELQVLEQTEPNVKTESKLTLEPVPTKEVVCPKCGSKDCWKRGNRVRNCKEYSCKDCKKFFIIYPLVDEEGKEINCPDCKSRNYRLAGQARGKRRYQCKECNRKYVLNPNGRDDLNDVTCNWCNGKKFRLTGFTSAGKRTCKCLECQKYFTVGGKSLTLSYPKEFDFNHDVWIADHLGYERGIHKHYKLNFAYLKQAWLKKFTKQYILYLVSTGTAFSTLITKVTNVRIFSDYLASVHYRQQFEGITRDLIVDFLAYLKIKGYSHSTHTHTLETLSKLFEMGILNDWFQVPPALIRPEDRLKKTKRLPRFIPEEVLKQLKQHLNNLPEPLIRMVLVDLECGFRIGELTRLKLDCLKSDGKGGWYIQYQMYKMNKEHTKPISNELANVIQEQQAYIKRILGSDFFTCFAVGLKEQVMNLFLNLN